MQHPWIASYSPKSMHSVMQERAIHEAQCFSCFGVNPRASVLRTCLPFSRQSENEAYAKYWEQETGSGRLCRKVIKRPSAPRAHVCNLVPQPGSIKLVQRQQKRCSQQRCQAALKANQTQAGEQQWAGQTPATEVEMLIQAPG